MTSTITKIPNRNDLVSEHEAQAQLYLRTFDPKRYSGFYQRIYDAPTYLEQVGIEKICELIEHGCNLMAIAKLLDISTRTLRGWVHKDKWRRQQVQEAIQFAGDGFAYKAEEVLKGARGGSREDISVAKALAEHYHWMASKLNKEQFGEMKKDDPNAATKPLVFNVNITGGPQTAQMKTVGPVIESIANKALGVTLDERE
jgi:hypothetical protein